MRFISSSEETAGLKPALFKLCSTRPLPLHQYTPKISVKMILLTLAQRSSAIFFYAQTDTEGTKKNKENEKYKKKFILTKRLLSSSTVFSSWENSLNDWAGMQRQILIVNAALN